MDRRLRVAVAAVVFSFAPLAGGQSIFDDTWKPGDSRPPVTPGATTRSVSPAGDGASVPADPGEAAGSEGSSGTASGAIGGTARRVGSTGMTPWRGAGVDLRTMQNTPEEPADMFPPIPWEEAARGVVQLRAAHVPSPTRVKGPSTTPATAPVAAAKLPAAIPYRVDELRRRYTPVVSERGVKDYTDVFGAEERRVAGKPEEQLALSRTLRTTAADFGNQREMQRYVLIRAFVLAREGRAPLATITEVTNELYATLRERTPAVLQQRAELAGAIAEIWIEAGQAAGSSVAQVMGAEAAARVQYDLALWQLNHNYLDEVPGSVDWVEQYARVGKLEAYEAACRTVRKALAERLAARDRYVTLVGAVAAHPDDAKANADLAMFLLTEARDVVAAAGPAGRSGDAELKALGDALNGFTAPPTRRAAIAFALAAMSDRAAGDDKTILARLAVENLEEFFKMASPQETEYTRARLYLSRLRPLAAMPMLSRTQPLALASLPRTARPAETARNSAPRTTAAGNPANGSAVAGTPPVKRAVAGGSQVPAPMRPGAPVGAAAGAGDGAVVPEPIVVDRKARRIVFIIDGTGSMMNQFERMRTAVERAVSDLDPGQSFNCVMFAEGAQVPFQRAPVPASDGNKYNFRTYLQRLAPHGSSDPLAALHAALAQGADTIYLMTDGEFPNTREVFQELRRLNTGAHRAKIHTIGVMADANDVWERHLRLIAEESGGTFRYLVEPRRR